MNFKRISAAALALAMTASLGSAALAADRPDGWTPADGARAPLLISPAPEGDSVEGGEITTVDMPTVDVPAPNGGYKTVITINGKALESFDFDYEVPGWGSQVVTWRIDELDAVPTGYIPLRAVIQADGGSAFWDSYEYCSSFYYESDMITANFNDMSVSVNDEKVEGAQALLLNGVTYVPATVLNKLSGVTVTDNSTAAGESYEITTPNGTPLMMLATQLLETAGMGRGMKATPAEMEEFYGESLGLKAEYMSEGVGFFPMMINADALILFRMADGSKEEEIRAAFEAYKANELERCNWGYLMDNLPTIENAQIAFEGDWALFLIAENAEAGVETFRAAVQAMSETQAQG